MIVFNEETRLGEIFKDEDGALDCVYYVTKKMDLTDEQEMECLTFTINDIADMEGVDPEKLCKKIKKYYRHNKRDFIDSIEYVSDADIDFDDEEDEDTFVHVNDVFEQQSEVEVQQSEEPEEEELQIEEPEEEEPQIEEPEEIELQIEEPKEEVPAEEPKAEVQPAEEPKPVLRQPSAKKFDQADSILQSVKEALEMGGYDPYKQLTQYFLTKDATYITSKNNARNLIRTVKIDDLVEYLIREYYK